MPDKLTDSEIVKALEDTLHRIKGAEHLIVPKEGVKNLCNGLENVLDLINRLQAEKQNLEVELQAMRGAANSYKAENEKLKKEKDEYAYLYDKHINTAFSHIKAEAYKEFAERLKKAKQYSIERHENIVPVAVIDWILKELVGEDNAEEKE